MNIEAYPHFPAALDALVARLNSRVFSPDRYYVVLTPDRYTLNIEKALFSGRGALDCEVLTLSRLAGRLDPGDRTLSHEGGVMLTARAVAAVRDRLQYYCHASGFYEFAREIYDAFGQISSSDLDITRLSATGATAAKLADLALIRAEYDRLKGEDRDASDKLYALIEDISHSEFVKNTHFFAIGYALGERNTTRLNRRVFDAISRHAAGFTYFDALPPGSKRHSVTAMRAADKAEQYKYIAARIRKHVDGGGRYGDVSVICPYPRVLGRILREYGIEAYTDEAVALSDTPPFAAIDCIYRLSEAADGQTLVTLCKNPFSGCDEADAAQLQRELAARDIGYGALDREYTDGAKRAADRAKQLVSLLSGGFCRGVRAIVEEGDFAGIQAELYQGGTDAVTPILALADLLERYGAGDESDADGFFSAARAVQVKSLPRKKDRVTVTTPQTLRMTACPVLFITDFNEGVLPAVTADDGLLDDRELNAIRCPSGRIEPTAREQNRRARAELKAVVANAGEVFCSYTGENGGRPSSFICELAERVEYTSYSERAEVLKKSDDGQYIADFACVPAAAREVAARALSSHSKELRAAAGNVEHVAVPRADTIQSAPRTTLSASELTHWFTCPYKRFLQDVVGVTERRKTRFNAADFGIVVHEFMQRFMADPAYDCSKENISAIVDDILKSKGIEADDAQRERLYADAADYAAANVAIVRAGSYTPTAFEKRFGGEIKLGSAGVELVGVIDRIDTCGGRARIIDYKTNASKSFSMAKCLSGLDMQLPLYAAVTPGAAGFFYVPLAAKYGKRDKLMSGRLIAETDIVEEYDGSLRPGKTSELCSVSFKTEKDGTYSVSGRGSTAMQREEFAALIDRCVENASVAADEMTEGYAARSPVVGACKRCPYFGICGERGKRVRSGGDDE